MSKWYIRQDGESLGSFSSEEIALKLKRRELRPIDFVYNVESGAWRIIQDCDEFVTVAAKTGCGESAEWIALKADGTESAKRRTLGPFDSEAILRQLASGQLSYSDYVWHPERPQWTRIGTVDELDRNRFEKESVFNALDSAKLPTEILAALPAEFSTERLYVNVQRARNAGSHRDADVAPPEAIGFDLADPTRSLQDELMAKFKLFSLLVLTSMSFLAPRAQAESIEAVILRANSTEPTLLIRTDAPIGSRIDVRLDQALGDVPGLYRFSHDFVVTREAGELPTVPLAELELAPGTYRIHATVNHRETRQSFFRGVRDADFENALGAFRKEVSFYQQEQKKALFYGAKKLRSLTQSFIQRSEMRGEKIRGSWLQKWNSEIRVVEAAIVSSVEKQASAYPERHDEILDAIKTLRSKVAESDSRNTERSVASTDSVDAKPNGRSDDFQKLADRFDFIRQKVGNSLAPGNE